MESDTQGGGRSLAECCCWPVEEGEGLSGFRRELQSAQKSLILDGGPKQHGASLPIAEELLS
jgi:hypothetical protein